MAARLQNPAPDLLDFSDEPGDDDALRLCNPNRFVRTSCFAERRRMVQRGSAIHSIYHSGWTPQRVKQIREDGCADQRQRPRIDR